MIGIADAFAPDYARARVKFLEAAAVAGAAITSYPHPLPGRDGEALALDAALDGPPDAKRLLLVSSGCHGIEGYCGSGMQVFALNDAEWRDKARAAGVAVLYLHALNPWGFSHGRRVTEDNADLNRNFQPFGARALPVNAAYTQIHELLLPRDWPPDAGNQQALGGYAAQHGMVALQTAISQGQHAFAKGLFFGGTEPTWSNRTVRRVLREKGSHATRLGWIDIHSGLGESGIGERIFAGRPDDRAALLRARRWWGDGVTSPYDGSSVSASVTGTIGESVYEELPHSEFTGIALEFGTLPLMDVLTALRGEQWLQLHADTVPSASAARIRQRLKDAFYVDTDAWRGQVVSQARQALFQAADGLAAN